MCKSFDHYTYLLLIFFFFFNDTATTEIYPLSLHDALPICHGLHAHGLEHGTGASARRLQAGEAMDFTRTRSEEHTSELHHLVISYAVFCLKKKKKNKVLSI